MTNVFAVTKPTQEGEYYPPFFNFTQTGPGEVTLHVRAKEKRNEEGHSVSGDYSTFILDCDDVAKLAQLLNGVIARFTSNA